MGPPGGKGKSEGGKGHWEDDFDGAGFEKGGKKGDRRKGDTQRDGKGGEKGYRKGDGKAGDKGEKGGEKGDRKGDGKAGDKGDRKGDSKGSGKGKKDAGKGKVEPKVISKGLRGKIYSFLSGKASQAHSGFIRRADGENDVYFDLVDVIEGEPMEKDDVVEFDIVEGSDKKHYAARIKKLPKDTDLKEAGQSLKSTAAHVASKTGSLTGGGLSLGPSKLGGGKLTGAVSLRPGGLTGAVSLRPGGQEASAASPKVPSKPATDDPEEDTGPPDDCCWGRVVSVRGTFAFLQQLGNDAGPNDIFCRAADVVGMNSLDPGSSGPDSLEIVLPNVRNSNGFKKFYLNLQDEVSYVLSKDHMGKPCAASVVKERKGAWRTGRRGGLRKPEAKKESVKDKVKRLTEMDVDELLQNVSLFEEVLESPEFDPSHLHKIVPMLGSKDLADETRSDRFYRVFLDSSPMQASLRTTIIKQGAGKHNGNFLEEVSRVIVEIVMRTTTPKEIRGQLPLVELVEAWENSVRMGSTVAKKGLSEDVVGMLKCLEKTFPEDVVLDRVLGLKAPKAQRSAAESYSELLEADHYRDMPILPTSAEMIGQCAFEVTENMRTYDTCEDYIQTHFMLLREDYIEPLRVGIKLFMQNKHSPKDLRVYQGVKVVGVLSTWEGLVYRIELRKEEIRKINWGTSKQLMYGSLLCFSDDNFESLIWATVWRRDEDLIAKQSQLDVKLPFNPWDDRIQPGKVFCCIENVSIYFEAYRHVLVAMQNMRSADVPFQNTLLPHQPDPVPPTFVKAENDLWHFHNVFTSCEKADSPVAAPKSFNILQEWPEALRQALDLDPSQLDAVQHSLTHAFALIQGPPGTGKTFVGLKIVHALLENTKSVRHSPILVVCMTNHALDSFLEGIYNICESMVRIGSRSKSELMMQRNLKELLAGTQPSREYFQARRSLMDRRDHLREELVKAMEGVDRHYLAVADAKNLMTESQFEQFYQGFLDYFDGDLGALPEDPWEVDDEVWHRVMKVWLETKDPEKLAPIVKHQVGGLPSFGLVDEEEDEEDFLQAINDGAEEEAAHEKHDRNLDVEQQDEKKKSFKDFFQEMNNTWLPYWEDHLETLSPEMRSLNWTEENLWSLPRDKRREIYRQWLIEAHHEHRSMLPELARLLERNSDQRAALERDKKLAVLREMQIVGMTTTAVSKYQLLLKELRPEICIVEEAAEVLESHILTALHARTQHVVLIGDHQQLRPSTAVYRLSKNFNLDVSLFERLIHNGAEHVTLLQQRRMHPKVSRLIKPLYPLLRDHPRTSEYPEVKGVDARCFFMKHCQYEDSEGESHSKENSFEAHMVAALCAHLVQSGYEESQITVLSPYLGQVRLLKQKLKRDPTIEKVHITAVDNFQGEENDIIVISLVRSNRAKQMGFLAVDNRINVALTRAKHGMFIFGNADMLVTHPLWQSIISELESDNCIRDALPLIDKENGEVFEVRTPDEISVLLGNDLHDTGGAGMISLDEYRSGQQAKKNFKGKGRGRGAPVADRWSQLETSGKGGGKKSGKGKHSGVAADESFSSTSISWPAASTTKEPSARPQRPTKSIAGEDGVECELVEGKRAEEDEEAGKKGGSKKKKPQKQKQVLLMRG